MLKCLSILTLAVASATAFVAPSRMRAVAAGTTTSTTSQLNAAVAADDESSKSRLDFLKVTATASTASLAALLVGNQPAHARGRATLEQSYERYAPRIRAGGTFYATDLKKLVAAADFEGVKNALAEPPKRSKSDLTKPDSGVVRAGIAVKLGKQRFRVATSCCSCSVLTVPLSVARHSHCQLLFPPG